MLNDFEKTARFNKEQLKNVFIEKMIEAKKKKEAKDSPADTVGSSNNTKTHTDTDIEAPANEEITISIFFNVLDELVSHHHFMQRSKATRMKRIDRLGGVL